MICSWPVAIRFDVIWYARNQVSHGKELPTPPMMIKAVESRYLAHQRAWMSLQRDEKMLWKPPDPGQFKINYDVAVLGDSLCMAAMCHDNLGNIILARTSRVAGRSPIKGEARAARLACQMASSFSAHEIILEGDCLTLVNQVVDATAAVDWDISGEVITIRRLLQDHPTWSFKWIPREANVAAHNLAKWCSLVLALGSLVSRSYRLKF